MDMDDLRKMDVPMKHIHRLEAVNKILPKQLEIETVHNRNKDETVGVLIEGGEPVARTAAHNSKDRAIVKAIHLAVIESYGDTVVPEIEPPLKQSNGNGSETQHAQTA